ncbi:hypothetical protein B0H19DRAFT_1245420 [Mycena capillaripes]|nr:hypothetical protein B0H19DRAFT_1245420 [Mycena capillaripes]
MPVEFFHIWLNRSGNIPLTLQFEDCSQAGELIQASLAHAHHWQDVKLMLPPASIPKLNLRHTSFPIPRSISLDIPCWLSQPATEPVVIQDAPLLREAQISALPRVKIDLPWPQMTALTLHHSVDFMECLSLLQKCPVLNSLTVFTVTVGPAAPRTGILTLHFLETLTCNLGEASIPEFITVPRLGRLTLAETRHTVALERLFRRSECPLRFFSFSGADTAPEMAIACLRALPDSVSDLELASITPRGHQSPFAAICRYCPDCYRCGVYANARVTSEGSSEIPNATHLYALHTS